VVGDDVLVAALVARVMGVTGVVNCQITAPAADVPIDATAKALCGVVGVS
jgi:phage-related baseplate assembly protein